MARRTASRADAPLDDDVRAIGAVTLLALAGIVALDQVVALGALSVAPRDEVAFLPRVAASLVTVVVLVAVLTIARRLWLATAWARRHPSVLVLTVMLGVQSGLLVSRGLLVRGGRLTPGTTIGLDEFVFLMAVTLVVLRVAGLADRHREALGRLDTTRDGLQAVLADGEKALRSQRRHLGDEVRRLLEDRLGTNSLRPSPFSAETLRSISAEVLRPLSHRLADDLPSFSPDLGDGGSAGPLPRWRVALRAVRPRPVVRPRLLAATMLFLTFRRGIRDLPADAPRPSSGVTVTIDWGAFAQSMLLLVATYVIVLLLARVLAARLRAVAPERSSSRAWLAVAGGLTTMGVASFGLIRILHLVPPFGTLPPAGPLTIVGFTLPLALVTVTVSLIAATEQALAAVRTDVEAQNLELTRSVARTNAFLAHEQRTFARHLHASVQAAVNAASLILERGTDEGEAGADAIAGATSRIEEAVEGLMRLLPGPSGTSAPGDATAGADDLEDRFANIQATWEGIATITLDISVDARGALIEDAVARITATDLVAEACANAVVHGQARKIDVRLGTEARGLLTFEVRDDGGVVDERRQPGLGTRTLDELCTEWRLDRRSDGVTLTGSLPTARRVTAR